MNNGVKAGKDILISGYPHDYVEKGEFMIDGGRSGYIRTNQDNDLVQVFVMEDQFLLSGDLINRILNNLKEVENEYC